VVMVDHIQQQAQTRQLMELVEVVALLKLDQQAVDQQESFLFYQ
jgi:hypothetical protein